jgi:hypothetical protein
MKRIVKPPSNIAEGFVPLSFDACNNFKDDGRDSRLIKPEVRQIKDSQPSGKNDVPSSILKTLTAMNSESISQVVEDGGRQVLP